MITSCHYEVPNPFKTIVRDILAKLVCSDNDYRRLNVTLRELRKDHQREIDHIERNCGELREQICGIDQPAPRLTYTQQIVKLEEMTTCFKSKMEKLTHERDAILANAKECYELLLCEKCKMHKFHENTLDELKRHAIQANEPHVVQECEKTICDIQQLFLKEVMNIRSCEQELLPFLDLFRDHDKEPCNFLAKYAGEPAVKPFQAVTEIANKIKANFGATLKEVLAQAHVHQPADLEAFIAAYLLNMERNKQHSQEFMRLFGPA